MAPGTYFEIPRDNLFHACLYLCAIIAELEGGYEKAQFERRKLNESRLHDEVNSVVALLVDTLPDEENREVAAHLMSTLELEFDDGYVFDPATRSLLGAEPTVRVPKMLFLEAFAYLMAYDRQDTSINLFSFFPNPDMHHMIEAQIHGTLYMNECLEKLIHYVHASTNRMTEFEEYKVAHADEIAVDIWDFPT